MKFVILKSSDRYYRGEKDISTLEELIQFMDEQKTDGIIVNRNLKDGTLEIEIYDTYRE